MAGLIVSATFLSLLVSRAHGQCKNHSHTEHEAFLTPLFAGNYTTHDNEFTYVIGICSKAKVTACSGLTNPQSAAVVQVNKDGGCYVLGRNSSAQMAKGREWLELLYTDGDKYRQHCDQEKRKTRIMFVCDPDAGKGKPIFLEENRDDQDCAYLFEWSTSLVCAGASNGLSPGSITLIVLFSVVVAYLLFGFLYQRFVVGAKGMEQIPNFTFWRKVGNLSADGCDMVCRCSEKAPPAKYKIHENLKDEDDDDEDSEKDDSLLPM